jgi:anti-anti-sigma factor
MPRAFKLTKKQSSPTCLEILIEGELDLAVRHHLTTSLEQEPWSDFRYVLIDLERCEFIDLSAIAVIGRAEAQLAAAGKELLIFGARGQVQRIFSQTGLLAHCHRPSLQARAGWPDQDSIPDEPAAQGQGRFLGGIPG